VVAVDVNVNVTLPAATPVTRPAFVTVAFVISLLVHVPPVVGDKVMLLPTQTEGSADTTGRALIVTAEVVLLQPVAVSVNVNVTEPGAIPVMRPALDTVALVGSLLVQVPPDVGDKVPLPLTHTADGAVTVGNARISTISDLGAPGQPPFVSITCT
jgi:hypothetical protein